MVSEKTEEIRKHHSSIKPLEDRQTRWLLHYYSMRSKINYLMRTVPSHLLERKSRDFVKSFEDMQEDFMCHLVEGKLKDRESFRARLPLTRGGFGLGFQSDIAKAAYLSSTMTATQAMIMNEVISSTSPWLVVATNALDQYLAHRKETRESVKVDTFFDWIEANKKNDPNEFQSILTESLIDKR